MTCLQVSLTLAAVITEQSGAERDMVAKGPGIPDADAHPYVSKVLLGCQPGMVMKRGLTL